MEIKIRLQFARNVKHGLIIYRKPLQGSAVITLSSEYFSVLLVTVAMPLKLSHQSCLIWSFLLCQYFEGNNNKFIEKKYTVLKY